jgi:predicted PurR-regulated permease PerM
MKEGLRIDQTLTLVVLAILILGCFFVLQPFLTAIIWAAILCATLWPLFLWTSESLGGRRGAAAGLLVLLITITVLAPFVVVGVTIAENAAHVGELVHKIIEEGPPPPPAWIAALPLIGEQAAATWSMFTHDTARLLDEARKYVDPARKFLVSGGATVLGAFFQLALSIFIAYFFLRDGEAVVARLRAAVDRIAPVRGRRLADITAVTVRSVVLGILGTALAQGVLTGIGLAIAGIKVAPLLGLAAFFLSPVPIGTGFVWIPVGVWMIAQGDTGWGIFVLVWGAVVVSSIDNFVKPMIISRGSDLPFVLVLLGVLGGVIAFGFIGVFLGPVLLAVGYALVKQWAVDTNADAPAPAVEAEPETAPEA